MLDWSKLISDQRVGGADGKLKKSKVESDRSPFQADYDRVIYSAPFRRLGRKTQVHPLAPNDHVRNRLTHSLEVASVGRSFATRLWNFLDKRGDIPQSIAEDDFRQILQTSCLAHDIGNPPFGHAGEYAIRAWAKENRDSLLGLGNPYNVSDAVVDDWEIFEGNAQGFRLASRPDISRFGYMNLTISTLGSMVKYPFGSAGAVGGKYNFLSSEAKIFDGVFDALGLKHDGRYMRHPLSFLSEAADDLCYRIADLEDAVRMNILEASRVRSILASVCKCSEDEKVPVGLLRAKAVGCFVEAFWKVFEDDYEAIMQGDRTDDLKKGVIDGDVELAKCLEQIKTCYDEIFAHRFKVATEYGAYNTLGRIINALAKACRKLVELSDGQKAGPGTGNSLNAFSKSLDFGSRRCLELTLGKAFVVDNINQDYSWWLHCVLDFVSSLTDNYAKQLSSEIAGF